MLPQSFHQNCVMSPTALRDGELFSIWGKREIGDSFIAQSRKFSRRVAIKWLKPQSLSALAVNGNVN